MRELFLVVPGSLEQRTGGYRYDARMVAGLRGRGWAVQVCELAGDFPGPNAAAEGALDAALAGIPDGGGALVDGLAAGAFPDVLARHASRLRLIYLLHHPLGLETGLEASQAQPLLTRERNAVQQALGVVATSAFTARQLLDWGVPAARLRAVPPGVEPRPEARGPGTGEPPRLICVGSVVPRKGQLELVQALARLDASDWRAVLVGSRTRDPTYVREVETAIAAAGLEGQIEWGGECDDTALEAWYERASLFVLASAYEGFGMAYTEAMARALPVIGTHGGAIPHTVPEGAGLLVPPGDVAALAGVIAHLVADPEARARMGRVGRESMRASPDWRQAAASLEQTLMEWLR